ncbi:hypothetical protein [Actinomycetospora cinnamomea]|uniref:Uncharacterized protein n=1 Tax=Actinomycetospora cinnamomea TaxID=663609 RepID=A0A2U1F7B5_9PSEU|nr:hypothetical protein [Actinomycetospora cinnamomea]PVZ07860.1 hypothetical protein C8D89_11013 [Actinomycetospora cinnamomea]
MSMRTYDVPETPKEWYPQTAEDAGPAYARGDAVDVIQRAERVAKEADNLRAFLIDHARHVPEELDQ